MIGVGVDEFGGFERFCLDAHPQLVAALTHQVGNRWLAEELAQEALVRAGHRWSRVSRMSSPVGWAFRVGANLARSHLRRVGAERRALMRAGWPDSVHHDPDGADTVAVRQALAALSTKQREVVVLRFYFGLSAPEAGEVLRTSSGAVRALTHRALQRLREQLEVPMPRQEDTDVS